MRRVWPDGSLLHTAEAGVPLSNWNYYAASENSIYHSHFADLPALLSRYTQSLPYILHYLSIFQNRCRLARPSFILQSSEGFFFLLHIVLHKAVHKREIDGNAKAKNHTNSSVYKQVEKPVCQDE